jgi:transketolase
LIDRNKLQGFGSTEDVMKLGALDEKLKSFGFDVVTVNGHNYDELNTIKEFHHNATNPIAVICNTIKGNGWTEHQNQLACHYVPFKENEYKEILESIENQRKLIEQ